MLINMSAQRCLSSFYMFTCIFKNKSGQLYIQARTLIKQILFTIFPAELYLDPYVATQCRIVNFLLKSQDNVVKIKMHHSLKQT